MNFRGKYEKIVENVITRYQSGGLLIGDFVKIKSSVFKHPKIKDLGDNTKGAIKAMIDSDLPIKVCATKSEYPETSAAGGMGVSVTTVPTNIWVDVCQEYAPGLFKNPMTLPIEVLEVIDTGINTATGVPDSLRRKDKTNIKPKPAEYTDNGTDAAKHQLPTKNTVLDFTKGSAKQPVMDSVKKSDEDLISDAYSAVRKGSKAKTLTVCVPNVFSENVEVLLCKEDIQHSKKTNGGKTFFDVVCTESKEELEMFIRKYAVGNDTFMRVTESDQQFIEH